MRLEQLQYLLEAVQCQSISKAAEKLYVSQPALSSALSALEKELGTELLTRTAQGVIPTAAGLRILSQAQDVVTMVGGWKNLCQQSPEQKVQLAFCGLPPAHLLLEEYLHGPFKRLFPSFDSVLTLAHNHDITSYGSSQYNFIGFGSFLENERTAIMLRAFKAGFQINVFTEDYLALYVRADHHLLRKDHVSLADLSELVFSYGKSQCDPIPVTYQRFFNPEYQIVTCSPNMAANRGIYKDVPNVGTFYPKCYAKKNLVENHLRELTVPEIHIPIYHYMLCPERPIVPEVLQVADDVLDFFKTQLLEKHNT